MAEAIKVLNKVQEKFGFKLNFNEFYVGGAAIDKIIKICNGLGITADDLANIGEPYTDGYYTDREAAEFAEYLRTRPGARMLFSAAKDISKEDLEKAVEYIELLKLKNK